MYGRICKKVKDTAAKIFICVFYIPHMEDEDILMGIGISAEELMDFRETQRKLVKGYTYLVGAGGLLIPMIIIAMFFEFQGNDFGFVFAFAGWFLPVSIFGMYFMILLTKASKKYSHMIEKTWLIWPGSQLLNNRTNINLIIAGLLMSCIAVFIMGYIAGEITIIIGSFIFLLILPALPIIKKMNKKQGFTIKHLFKSDVDALADKLAIALRGEKKVIMNGKNNKRYQILLPDENEIKIFISNRAERKYFSEVTIMGVKMSNIKKTKKLILEIEKTLE